jgi:membrane-bound serine protease (ClpP class)
MPPVSLSRTDSKTRRNLSIERRLEPDYTGLGPMIEFHFSPHRFRVPTGHRVPAFLGAALLLLTLSPAGSGPVSAQGGEPSESAEAEKPAPAIRPVLRIRVDSAIQPVVAEFIRESLKEADDRDAQLLVLELATPGGLSTSMRKICTAILGSATPVAVYVSPSGSHAASAGFFILMAADIAAMAPGTNTGAAASVGGQGEDIKGTMGKKVEQDAAAYIRSLATRKGRNVELAESAVLGDKAKAFSAEEALEGNLIDLISPSLTRLLVELDGREIEKNGRTVVLETADAPVEELEMRRFQRILAILADPTIAFLLLSLGGLGIYFELMNPGAIFPGVFGAIALVLAFFGLSVLPFSYAGVALILLSLAFFIAEIKVQSFGLLTIGGVVSLVLGAMLLIKSPEPAMQVSWQVIAAVAVTAILVVAFLFSLAYRAFRNRVRTGAEGMVTERGVVREALDPRGKVWVHGELWSAYASEPIPVGEEVEVVAVDGMRIEVRRIAEPSPSLPRHAEA